jgi:hydrogenase maturation protease
LQQPVRIIGIGNDHRRDDAAGLEVVRRLKEQGVQPSSLGEHAGESMALLDAWSGAAAVILVDAAASGAPPGTLHRLEAGREPLPARFFRGSTHAFSLADAVELGRALGRLPPRVIFYGIEGREFGAGTGLSPEAARATRQAVEQILKEFRALQSSAGGGIKRKL